MRNKIIRDFKFIKEPDCKSSYKKDDCIMLLKDLTSSIKEISTEEKEKLIQSGVSYSELLSKEGLPNEKYVKMFLKGTKEMSIEIAYYIAYISELILLKYNENIKDLVLVSLARAGSPVGILVKRYMKQKYDLNVPHYSTSIIRGKGFDENAIKYIYAKHNNPKIQFIDGWTGKGSISLELTKSVKKFYDKYEIAIDDDLAVIADPAGVSTIYGTRKDIFIPNCCLNSTVSGLISRTFENKKHVNNFDFHGVKYFSYWKEYDYSNLYIDEISKHFNHIQIKDATFKKDEIFKNGMEEVLYIQKTFNIGDINKIKPSIGETTRVLLRRIPKVILIKNLNNKHIAHILYLAKMKNIKIIEYKNMSYETIGIINDVNSE